ncbi:hypothetical protein NL676_011927 [Syzygium grande]|nr:hypothetical protein NL676_011927 [Syzygium grande]
MVFRFLLSRKPPVFPQLLQMKCLRRRIRRARGRFVIRIRLQSKADNDGSPARINPSPVERDEEKKKRGPWDLRPGKDAQPWHCFPEKDVDGETKSKKMIPDRMRKLPVALSREEIEEDLAFLTGGKRPRKMQKRPRSARQHNDDLFPGAHLGSITIKSYNVH